MRLINQEKTFDAPYEQVAVIRDDKKLFACIVNQNTNKDTFTLGEYETAEDAIKALDSMERAFQVGGKIFNF